MNIKLLAIGKTDNKALQSLIDDYIKRLSFYINFDLEVIPDIKNAVNLSEEMQKIKEGEIILGKINAGEQLILLDEAGKSFTSVFLFGRTSEKNEFRNQDTRFCNRRAIWFFGASLRKGKRKNIPFADDLFTSDGAVIFY